MKYEKYADIIATSDFSKFAFTSTGPKGSIPKLIQFTPTHNDQIVHLVLGNVMPDGSLDDLAVDNNKDRNKILATVVSAIDEFTKHYPKKWIFISGSTTQRTRLYRMAITINLDELSFSYEVLGILKDLDSFVYVPFEKEIDYFGFLIRRKKV